LANVIITDDHPFLRMGVSAILEMGGHNLVGAANDAAETHRILETADPEILLLDIRLPGQDGISLLRELRESGDNRRVIILTVEITDDQLLDAIQCKVDGIVLKHEGEDKLLAAIDAVQRGLRFIDSDLYDRALQRAGASNFRSALESLTSKEIKVARLVAAGMRNREIAKQLLTTEGTIKVHLHKIYTKIGISNRTELATLIANEDKSGRI